MQCGVKVGFLIVRECGRMATTLCTGCQQPFCPAHAVEAAETPLCIKCAGKQPTASENSRKQSSDSDDSSLSRSSSVEWEIDSSTSDKHYSGKEGQFSGAGSSARWTPAKRAAAQLAITPTNLGADPLTAGSNQVILRDAGFSQSDAALFDDVRSFDQAADRKDSFDS
jgi:hypothetical protein